MQRFKQTTLAKDSEHKFFFLDEKEKAEMFSRCKSEEDYIEYWTGRLKSEGITPKKILRSVQLKDQGGEWMNVFKINFL